MQQGVNIIINRSIQLNTNQVIHFQQHRHMILERVDPRLVLRLLAICKLE